MKREWYWTQENCTDEPTDPLWALVERLEALVGVMDDLGEVGDVIANHLTFGGQPVGDMTPHPANWQCQKTKDCTLFNGHQGSCICPHDRIVTDGGCLVLHPATDMVCQLLAGHEGIHVFPEPEESDDVPGGYNAVPQPSHGGYPTPVIPARVCQCVTPVFVVGEDLCEKCGYPEDKNAE